jgi:hypothetical protein
MALFTDNLGTEYTGSPIVEGVPLQDDTYLYQKDELSFITEKEEYDFSHFPRFFGTFKDGEPDGVFTEWYDNGQKRSVNTPSGSPSLKVPKNLGKCEKSYSSFSVIKDNSSFW